jgi:hypothetical protein
MNVLVAHLIDLAHHIEIIAGFLVALIRCDQKEHVRVVRLVALEACIRDFTRTDLLRTKLFDELRVRWSRGEVFLVHRKNLAQLVDNSKDLGSDLDDVTIRRLRLMYDGEVRSAAWLLVLATACGRLRFDEVPSDPDGPLLGPFGAPVQILELSDPSVRDDDPSLTADLLELYFNSSRAGGPGAGDIWVATRATADVPWNPPTLVAALSSPSSETGPEVSADGLTIFFASDRAGTLGATDIWMSMRSSRIAPWGAPVHVPELSSTADETAPAIHASGLVIVLESTRGAGDANLWIATRSAISSTWAAPRMIDTSTTDHEGSPYLTGDGLTLVFNAIRSSGIGLADLYLATRAAEGDPFLTETRIEVSGAANDEDPWLSNDGRVLFFANNATGDLELYEARRGGI